jgi:hypothetical protein
VAEDQAPIEDGELLTPRVSQGNNPVSEAPRKNTSDNCTAVLSKKMKREGRSSKSASKKSKASKKRSYMSSSASSSDSSPLADEESSLLEPNDSDMSVAGPIIELATAAVFQDLSKTARTAMGGETPVPFHPDLRPKKVDTFVKKILKRKGANFNTAMDRRQLNMAGRMLDTIGPLSQLWKTAILAEEKATGIDPALERNISLS